MIGENIGLEELLPQECSVRLEYSRNPGNGVTIGELAILTLLVRHKRCFSVFEIGTSTGRTINSMAVNAAGNCYSLDIESGGGRIKVPFNVELLLGDSLDYDFTRFYGRMGLVFVDGAHDYQHALSDSKNALKMRSHKGIVVWHDVPWPDVNKALREIEQTVRTVDSTQLAVYP